MNGTNISKYIPGIFGNTKTTTAAQSVNMKTTNLNKAAAPSLSSVAALMPNKNSLPGRSSIARILSYFLAIVVVIMAILLFINYFITPIFRLRPGTPGIIPVPGFDDGTLFWNKTSASQILNKDLPIASQAFGYSINLDVFIQNPLQFSVQPRIFFSRGASKRETASGDTLLSVLHYYNLAAALLPDTNDMIVSVMNKDNNMENVIISNIPVQEPFRLSMIVREQALEVYINGHLMKTRAFSAPPKDIKGDIYPAAGIEANVVKVRNLKIWSRILTTSEVRYATPSLSTLSDFNAKPIPTSSTSSCATTAAKDATSAVTTATSKVTAALQSTSKMLSKNF